MIEINKKMEVIQMKIFSNPKLMTILNSLAVMVVATSANSACSWLFHQPEFPAGAEKFKR